MDDNYTTKNLVDIAVEGHKLSDAAAQVLEHHLLNEPSDVGARFSLLGYYFTRSIGQQANQLRRHAHILWCIENLCAEPYFWHQNVYAIALKSDNPTLYEEARQLWQRMIDTNPDVVQIRLNFAYWASFSEVTLAEKMFTEGRNLDPKHPDIESVRKKIHYTKRSTYRRPKR